MRGRALVLALLLSLPMAAPRAEEATEHGAASYAAAALLIVNTGVSLGNGIALARDRPDARNGCLGLAGGVVSLGFVAANLAWTDDPELRDDFTVVMGTAGLLSLALGAWTVHEARRPDRGSAELSGLPVPRLRILPAKRGGVSMGLWTAF